MPREFAFLDSPTPLAFAHRGGAEAGRENVASLFEQVRLLGYRYVETDVRTTADGVPVVFHDADLRRLTGEPERIGSLTMADLRQVRLGGGEQVAPLAEVLDGFPDLRFNLDLKDAGGVRAVPAALTHTGSHGRVCVTSFSQRRIDAARRRLPPGTCTGLGVGGVARFAARGLIRRPYAGAAAVVQLPWLPARPALLRRALEQARREGLAVHVWTLNDAREIRAAIDLGVDGIMTDRPALLKAELQRRGRWPD